MPAMPPAVSVGVVISAALVVVLVSAVLLSLQLLSRSVPMHRDTRKKTDFFMVGA